MNNDQRITFKLTAAQAKTPLTLRIGITIAYAEGRPQIDVNGGAWTSPLPEPSDQPKENGVKAASTTQKLLRISGIIKDGPSDASVNLDHYLYGSPK